VPTTSTNSTASTYYTKIDTLYPIAGQDNDSQGFRSNFSNIQNSLLNLDVDLVDLRNTSVRPDRTTDFGYVGTLKRPNLQAAASIVYDATNEAQAGGVDVVYTNGDYQKFLLAAGPTTFSVSQWPSSGKAGRLIIAVSPQTANSAIIDFPAGYKRVGNTIFPDYLGQTEYNAFYELWSDDGGTTVFVKKVGGDTLTVATASVITAVESLKLGHLTYTTASNDVTMVKLDQKYGSLALLPNQFTAQITGALTHFPGDTTATMFGVQTARGVYVGATTYINNTNTQLTVTAVSGTTITVTPAFPVGGFSVGSYITFTNPQFTTQPKLATLRTSAVTTLTGTTSDLPGQIYATTQSLYVSFTDHNEGVENWFKVSSDKVTMVTQATATNNTTLATTEFVHSVLPYGAIIMWYGNSASVPSGWALCDGSGDTPDLRDKFVIAAGPNYPVDSTGGSTSTSVTGSHDHTGITSATSITVPNTGWSVSGGARTNGVLLTGSGNAEIAETLESIGQTSASLDIGSHAHNIFSSGTHYHTVIPPYYALCYIMKVVG
jgi:hypothetical protein